MRQLLLILCLSISAITMAQPGVNTLWQKDLSEPVGPNEMEFNAVKATTNGLFVGGMKSQIDGLLMYAAFYSNAGSLMWDAFIPGGNRAWVNFVDEDAQGNFYTGGVEVLETYNTRQVHIAKLDANGNILWQQTYAGNMSEAELYEMKVLGNHIYICGKQDSANYPLAYVAKYDLNGNQVWAHTFDPGGGAWFDGLSVDNSGAVTVAGGADYGYSYFAAQYSSSGSLNWQYPASLTSNKEQYYSNVTTDNAGNVYLAGTEEGASSFDFNITTTKLNSSGSMVWSKAYAGGNGYSGKILLGPNGNVHCFASTEDNFDEFATVIKYDPSGNELWSIHYSLTRSSQAAGGEIDNAGNIFMGVREYDSIGFVKISPNSAVLAKASMSGDDPQYLLDISLAGSTLAGVGNFGNRAQLVSLQSGNLNENFKKAESGDAVGMYRPYNIAADGNSVWMSAVTDDGDTCRYYVTKMDGSGNVLWQSQDTYPCILSEFADLKQDGNGNVVGFYTNQEFTSNYTAVLVKYDASGNQVFQVMLDSAGAYEAVGLAISSSGDIYACGYNYAVKKMFLARYSSTGSLVWQEFYESPYTSFPVSIPRGIKISAQGKIVIVSTHRGANNVNDLHLFQYADDGTLEWHKDVDSVPGNSTFLRGLEIESNGDIVVFGTSGIGSSVLAKYDASGNEKWSVKEPLVSGTATISMTMDASGNVYAGFSASAALTVKKYDGAGNYIKQESHNFTSSGSFYFPWAMFFINNQLVILGDHNYSSGKVPFEMLLDDQLNLLSTSVNLAETGQFIDYALDGSGNIYELLQLPTYSLASIYFSRVKKMAVGPVGIADRSKKPSSLKVYPNPAKRNLRVHLPLEEHSVYSLFLYDIEGREIATLRHDYRLANPKVAVQIRIPESLPGGTYLLVAESEGRQYAEKVVVE